ncbi:MAG: hypothetical protein H0U54_13900 [Acidobacteria bacterium]|nr:hypothetical protein [Acidobacteriota bacterium]
MSYQSTILQSLCVCLLLLGAAHLASAQVIRPGDATRVGQPPQERMEALARTLNLGAKRADSERPQATTSGHGDGLRGFYQCFERGCIYYSSETDVRAVSGAIFYRYIADGAEQRALGLPIADEKVCTLNGGFRFQVFEGGRIVFNNKKGNTVVHRNPSAIGDEGDCQEKLTIIKAPKEATILKQPEKQVSMQPAQRESTIIPAPPRSARFRVTLNGFTVNHDTYDHALGYDGQGDEVYIIADVVNFNGAGNILTRRNLQTPIMGEANGQGERIQAGRATDRGGLRNGNQFPPNEPWQRSTELSERQPPMLLWEGTLTTGEGATTILIVPTIWERDELPQFVDTYRSNLDGRLASYVRTLSAFNGNLDNFIGGAPPLGDWVVGTPITSASHDRPIGMSSASSIWPKRMLLTYAIAQQAATSTRDGLGTGIFRVRYQDSEDLGGDYTLYIQIERVP